MLFIFIFNIKNYIFFSVKISFFLIIKIKIGNIGELFYQWIIIKLQNNFEQVGLIFNNLMIEFRT